MGDGLKCETYLPETVQVFNEHVVLVLISLVREREREVR